MGDSDDDRGEYDRRRRDKFRGERNDYDNRRPPPRGYGDQQRGRGDRNSHSWERGTKREYYGGGGGGGGRDQSANRGDRRDSYGGGGRNSPPFKKTKREWENDQPWKAPGNNTTLGDKAASNVPTLMSFKDFIIQQEDTIDEVESVRRYQEYKVEFKRTQINDFFVLHKDEEWFEEKYHPIKSIERRDVVRHGIKKRLKLFFDFFEEGLLDMFKLSITNNVEVLKLLDKSVIKLDGGTEEDLKALDFPPPKPEPPEDGEEPKTEDEINSEINGTNGTKSQDAKKPYNYDADGAEEGEEPDDPLPPGVEPDDEGAPGCDDEDLKDTVVINDDNESKGESEKKEGSEYVYDGSQVKRPYSLYMRGVPAVITRADLEAVCKRYPGFLRIAMSDPSADKQFARRAWASFDHTVNIKDICWNLSNIRVKEMELNPVVNRDVSNRVRPVNGITCSPITMQLDMNFIIKLVKKLDEKHELYVKSTNGNGEAKESSEETAETEDDSPASRRKKEEEAMNLPEGNPVIEKFPENIANMVTGIEVENEEDDKKDYPIIVNEELERFLDLLMLYLRIVHCIDYYNATDYVHEDEMPMRCGIMHVRAAPLEAASKKDALEWHNQNSAKLEHFLKDEEVADEETAEKLGKKKEEEEMENFIKANTQELAKDKWLCPLSGKKFRGPEFIRKHIVMKHSEHVDNVKSEVKYFNNYIYDLKRPCFPDARARVGVPGANVPPVQDVRPSPGAIALTGANTTPIAGMRPSTLPTMGSAPSDRSRTTTPGQQPVVFASPRPQYPTTPQNQGPPETYGRMNTFPPKAMQRGGSGQRGDYRKLIKYRDLDAPEESDFF